MLANGKKYSLACWIKIIETTGNRFIVKLGTNSCGLWWGNNSPRLVWNENDNGKRSATAIASDYTNWHHVVTVVDKSTSNTIKLTHYVDGVLSDTVGQTFDNTGMAQPEGTTITIAPYKALLNDIRLYDHALSAMEVKQISQGLILHYPLNNNGWGNNNLGLDTVGERTFKNSTLHYNLAQGVPNLIKGQTVTISADLKSSVNNSQLDCYVRSSSQLRMNDLAFIKGITTQYKRYSRTIVVPDNNLTPAWFTFRSSSGGSGNTTTATFSIKNAKIELGDKATTWSPNNTEELYELLGIDNEVEYDCSGYRRNGTKININYSQDTPKYNVSSVFNSEDNSVIETSASNFVIQGSQNMTISIWAYMDDWTQFNSRIYSCTQSGGFSIQPSDNNLQWVVRVYTNEEKTQAKYASSDPNLYLTVSKSSLSSGWHMFTWTYTTNGTKVYVDGQLKTSREGVSYGLHFNTTAPLILGGEATASGYTSPYFNGKMSDFRIYSTTLSSQDILSLYNNEAYIDNNGNVYGAVYEED